MCAVFFSSFCPLVIAEEPVDTTVKEGLFPASSWTAEKTYTDKTAHKLGLGFLNISTGWMAILFEPRHGKYFFDGLGKGLFYAFTNTAGGVLQAATFPVPVDIPILRGGIAYEYNH